MAAKGLPICQTKSLGPAILIDLLGILKDDDSRYVQESVGNALRDINRKHSELVVDALRAWLLEKPEADSRRTIARYALKQGGAPETELWRFVGPLAGSPYLPLSASPRLSASASRHSRLV